MGGGQIATQQLIDIIIKATDQASQVAEKVDSSMRKIGDTSSKANQKAAKSTYEFNKKLLEANNSLQVVGGGAVQAANLLHQIKLDPNMGSSIDKARLKVSEMGISLDTVKGKFTVFKTVATPVFDNLKNKVTSVASSIKTKFTTAVDNMRTKIAQLSIESGHLGDKMMSLKGILENTLGSFVYDFAMGVIQSASASINASSQIDYFGQRLSKVSGQAHLSGEQFQKFRADLGDLQKEFRKVDMSAVGATAEELALKMNLPAEKLGDLTRMTAVLSSTFVKEGRSQEDAVLAVGDALDGQFKRLQEIGITQQELKDNGWSGELSDQAGLIDALNKTMSEMGYEQTAKDITNLNEAYTALSNAMGSLLQAVLVPLTPPLIQIVNWLLKMGDAIGTVMNMIGSFIGGMPDWAQIALGVTGLGLAFGILGTYLMTSVVPGMIASTIATINWVATALGAEATAFTLTGAFSVLGGAIWTALSPLLPFIVAAGLLAVAVYEVGKYFGWWTDIGSMIDAITAGLNRLWSAFINNPNVQGFLQDLKGAWDALCTALQPVVEWAGKVWESLFPPRGDEEFDVVRMIIDAFGSLGRVFGDVVNGVKMVYSSFGMIGLIAGIITGPIGTIVAVLRTIICALLGCSPGIVPALNTVQQVFLTVWNAIAGFVPGIVTKVASSIINNFKGLPGKMLNFLKKISTHILTQGTKWVSTAKSKASNLVTGVIGFLTSLPGKAYNHLANVGKRIISAGSQWVSNAKTKASSVVTGITSKLSNAPGQVYTKLIGIKDKIGSALSKAFDKAKAWVGKIKNQITSIGNTGPFAFGGADLAYGGEDLVTTPVKPNDDINVNMVQDINLSLDLRNVPSNVDEDLLYGMIDETLHSKEFIDALVSNPDFQSLDAKVKARISAKRNRARGV